MKSTKPLINGLNVRKFIPATTY